MNNPQGRLPNLLIVLVCLTVVVPGGIGESRAADPQSAPGTQPNSSSTNLPSLADIRNAFAEARTVFARFTQERHLSLFSEPLRSEGFLFSENPGRLRWEVTQPYRSILVSDGRGVAQFEWIEDHWQKLELGLADALQTVLDQIGHVVQGRYASGKDDYLVTTDRDRDGAVLTLVPRADRMRRVIQAVEVHLAADLRGTRQVLLRETTGDFTRIEFTDQRINAGFPPGTFDRTKPLPLDTIRNHLTPAAGSVPTP